MDFEPCFKVYNLVSVYFKSVTYCTWSNDNFVHDLSCGGVNLSIG